MVCGSFINNTPPICLFHVWELTDLPLWIFFCLYNRIFNGRLTMQFNLILLIVERSILPRIALSSFAC